MFCGDSMEKMKKLPDAEFEIMKVVWADEPLVSKEYYLKFETGSFMKQYHDSSPFNLINTLYDGKALTDKDLDELLK